MRKVLLLRPDQAGDALKTIPVIRGLLKAYPNTFDLSILCSPVNFSLFSFEPKVRPLLETQDSFDIAINLLVDPVSKVGVMLEKIRAEEKWSVPIEGFSQFKQIDLYRNRNCSESQFIAEILTQSLSLSNRIDIELEKAAPALSVSENSEVAHLKKNKNGIWIGFCPFSSIQKRSFSPSEIFRVLKEFEQNFSIERIFVFGLVSEFERLKKSHFSKVTFCSPNEFRSVGVYLQGLDGVIGVDTGIMHYALAYGLPVLVFGRGVDMPRWYSPLKPRDKVVPRGLVTPFPTFWERRVILKKWLSQLKLEKR